MESPWETTNTSMHLLHQCDIQIHLWLQPQPQIEAKPLPQKTTSTWTSFFAKILFPIDNKVCFIYQIRLLHPKRYWVLTKFQSEDGNYTDSWPRAPGNHNNLSFPLEFLQQFSRFLNAWYSCFIIKIGIFWNQI